MDAFWIMNFPGIVEKIGENVQNVQVGDTVVIETSTFRPYSDAARNGRVDLDGPASETLTTLAVGKPWVLQNTPLLRPHCA